MARMRPTDLSADLVTRKQPVDQVSLAASRQQALAAAQAAALILVKRFGAQRVYLFGSLAGTGSLPFRPESDVDLAVEALPGDHFWEALRAGDEGMPPGRTADVFCLESTRPWLTDAVRRRGILLAERDGVEAVVVHNLAPREDAREMERSRWLLLAEEITHELGELDDVMRRATPLVGLPADAFSELERGGVGLLLHDFYNGAERVFRRIAVVVDENLPSDAEWHQTLLVQMTVPHARRRPEVISGELHYRLNEYLGFRHVFRNIYSRQLEWDRLAKLLADLAATHRDLKDALDAFCAYLRQHPAGPDGPSATSTD